MKRSTENATNLLGRHDLLNILYRLVGIVANSFSTIIALKTFLNRPPSDAATLVALVGWLGFIQLGQLGYGRPVYTLIRQESLVGRLTAPVLVNFLRLFRQQAITTTIVFCAVVWFVSHRQKYAGPLLELLVFGLGLASITTCAFQRDLAYALSRQNFFEVVELVRRVLMLFMYLLLLWHVPLWIVGFICLAISMVSQALVWRALLPMASNGIMGSLNSEISTYYPNLNSDARRVLLFSICELLIYYFPLIVLSTFGSAEMIIYMGIWMRFFQLTVLPMRVVVDAKINELVRLYLERDFQVLHERMVLLFRVSMAVLAICILCIFSLGPLLIAWMGAHTSNFDTWFYLSLVIWFGGNLIQHFYGSFTLSYGNGFLFAARTSVVSMTTMCAVFSLSLLAGLTLPLNMSLVGIVYMLASLTYARHVHHIVRIE